MKFLQMFNIAAVTVQFSVLGVSQLFRCDFTIFKKLSGNLKTHQVPEGFHTLVNYWT